MTRLLPKHFYYTLSDKICQAFQKNIRSGTDEGHPAEIGKTYLYVGSSVTILPCYTQFGFFWRVKTEGGEKNEKVERE